jgi:hypothetical protein
VKFAAATPVTEDENTTFHETEDVFVGDAAFNVNDDTEGPGGAANTANAPHAPKARTPSSATRINRLALLAVPGEPRPFIRTFALLYRCLSFMS